jgi:hypothetical protein
MDKRLKVRVPALFTYRIAEDREHSSNSVS